MFTKCLKSTAITLIGVFILFVLGVVITRYIGSLDVKYPTNKDTWHAFGDGRFRIGGSPSRHILVLFDLKALDWHNVFHSIDRYFENDPYLYITSYSDDDKPNYGENGYSMFLPGTGEEVYFDSIDEIPQYLKLNYRTGEVNLYVGFEDVPEEDQKMFNKENFWWCKFRRTCFEND